MQIAMCVLILTISTIASSATAETLAAGQRYEGPKTLEVPALSIAFDLPAGWTGVLPAGTEWFHVGKDDEMGRVFIWATTATEQDVRSTMTRGFVAANAVQLTPTGELRTEGTTLVGDYDASDGTNSYKATVRAQLKNGVAVALVAVAPAEQLPQFRKLAVQIHKSVKFGVVAKSSTTGGGEGPWRARLANQRVSRFNNSDDHSEKTEFSLCADGTFYKKFRASNANQTGDGVIANRSGGNWSVQGNQLTFRWADGTTSQHTLEDRGGQLYVDGTRWLRTGAACQ